MSNLYFHSTYKIFQIFEITLAGLPPRYRDSVRAITPGLPLFLYNYTTHQLHGIFEVCILLDNYYTSSFIGCGRSNAAVDIGYTIHLLFCFSKAYYPMEVIWLNLESIHHQQSHFHHPDLPLLSPLKLKPSA